MLVNVRAIGNSKGVLIPTAFLLSCHIQDKVDMQLQDGQIVLRPVKQVLREGWFTAAAEADFVAADFDAWPEGSLVDESDEDGEWVW